jgi:hypothetical protein
MNTLSLAAANFAPSTFTTTPPRSVSSVWSTTAVIGSDRHIPRSWKTSESQDVPTGACLTFGGSAVSLLRVNDLTTVLGIAGADPFRSLQS